MKFITIENTAGMEEVKLDEKLTGFLNELLKLSKPQQMTILRKVVGGWCEIVILKSGTNKHKVVWELKKFLSKKQLNEFCTANQEYWFSLFWTICHFFLKNIQLQIK